MLGCCPRPRIEDCIGQAGGAGFVMRLDLLRGCWQGPRKFHHLLHHGILADAVFHAPCDSALCNYVKFSIILRSIDFILIGQLHNSIHDSMIVEIIGPYILFVHNNTLFIIMYGYFLSF